MKNIIEALNWRYAVKKFSADKIPQEKLDVIMESLRLTPSSFGLQAWRFIVVEDKAVREQLVAVSWNQRQVADASHLLVLARLAHLNESDVDKWTNFLAEKQNMSSEKKDLLTNMIKGFLNNFPSETISRWMEKQLYIALGNLLTTCALEEIDSCPIEGFDKQAYDDILGLEKMGLKSVVICPIGYRAADDPYQHLTKARYPKDDLVIHI